MEQVEPVQMNIYKSNTYLQKWFKLVTFIQLAKGSREAAREGPTGSNWNNLKGPTASNKPPETTWNKQEITLKDLQWARNDLKQPTISKKQPEMTSNNLMTYHEQETNWKDLQKARKSSTHD